MSEQEKTGASDRLVAAYERMLKRTHQTVEQAEKEAVPALRDLLHKSRDNMVELGELTREEAHKVTDYLERDIADAARYIAETGEDIKNWWRFDLNLIEQRTLEAFSRVADQTSVQLRSWAEQARQASPYHSGEVAGPGTLVCEDCGTALQMHAAGRIPPCARCRGTGFKRVADTHDRG